MTVYDLEGLREHSKEDLDQAFQEPFDIDLFRELAPKAKFKYSMGIWKGSRLAILKLKDGTEKRLAISYWGSFFKIRGEGGYYRFDGEAAKRFDKAFMDIVYEKFIPKRIERKKQQEENIND